MSRLKILQCISFCFFIMVSIPTSAMTLIIPSNGDNIVGKLQEASTITGDSVTSIGRRYEMGIMELLEANPDFKLDTVYGPAQKYIISSEFILPNTVHKGIVINLAELRLYFYVPNTNKVITFPVGVGREGWDSPLGKTYIVRKKADPTWRPTQHILESRLKDGVVLPKVVPPGPANPLGPYALYTAIPAILIHGSNDPSGVGRRSSSACFRMQPEAIESFFDLVPVGSSVMIVDEPIKTGWRNNDFYIEVHIPLAGDFSQNVAMLTEKMHKLVKAAIAKRPAVIDWKIADQAVASQSGYPVKIGICSC